IARSSPKRLRRIPGYCVGSDERVPTVIGVFKVSLENEMFSGLFSAPPKSVLSVSEAVSTIVCHWPVAGYSPPAVPARLSTPQAAKHTPATRPNQWPIGIVFSKSMKQATPAIQNRFMMPPKNKSPIRNQQQPRQ